MKNKEKGITLIALIVTIIIILILATVSISIIWNDNGIIKKAQEAGKLHTSTEIKEKLQLAVLAVESDIAEDITRNSLTSLEDITTESIQSKLEEGMKVQVSDIHSSEGKSHKIITVEANGKMYQYIIKEDLKINILDENDVNVSYTFMGCFKTDENSIDVDLTFDCVNGISKIVFPNGIEKNGENSSLIVKTGVNLKLNTDYTYIITTRDGTVKTKTINIKAEDLPTPEIKISNIIIGNSITATESVRSEERRVGKECL